MLFAFTEIGNTVGVCWSLEVLEHVNEKVQ